MIKHWAVVAIFSVLLSSCALHTGSLLPEDVDSIYIPLLKNETFRVSKTDRTFKRDIENVLTDDIIREFLKDGNLKILRQDQADWILEGAVTYFSSRPISFSNVNSDVPDEYRVSMSVKLTLSDLNTGEVVWQDEVLSRTEDFYVAGSVISGEDSALRQASELLAKDILIHVTETW